MVWQSIKCWAKVAPKRQALAPLSYEKLKAAIIKCAASLPPVENQRVGLCIGNRPLWGIYDLALTLKGAIVVPIPAFFSAEQTGHIITDANIDTLVVDAHSRLESKGLTALTSRLRVMKADMTLETISAPASDGEGLFSPDPQRISKIIYTSGTTGQPKGVMLTQRAIHCVTKSLIGRSGATIRDRHLSLLPLSTLVEAIGGLYVPLSVGATVIYPKHAFGPESLLFEPNNLKALLLEAAPTTLNLVPSLLAAMLEGTQAPHDLPSTLRFVACGGAPLQQRYRQQAADLQLPLFEGYGLSECSSVVSLNAAGRNSAGSAGRALPHTRVTLSEEGEILVSGESLMSGYTDGSQNGPSTFATGDLGYLDDEGYLHVRGRKDNLIVSRQGRNVSPEWVESTLHGSSAIRQAMVFADPFGEISAFIVPDTAWLSHSGEGTARDHLNGQTITHPAAIAAMLREIEQTSRTLPAYAAVKGFTLLSEPFSIQNGQLGSDGRLKRETIRKRYQRSDSCLNRSSC